MNVHADPEPEKHPGGRPPTYKPEFAEQAAKLCKLGATDYELADFFEVTTRTIYRWKNEHEEFCQAVKVGGEPADERVVRSLYNRAVGYTFESEKVFNASGVIVRASTLEHVPPDPGAAMNWLKNRKRDEWSDNRHVSIEGGITHQHELRDISRVIMEILEEAAQAEAQPVIEHQEE